MEREKLVALVKAVQAGKETAAGDLYSAFYEDIYYFILKSVDNDRELAEDLTQDTFMEILETIGKLQEPAAFVTWSRQIAYHKCTAYFRKRREILLDEAEDGYSVFDTVEEDRTEFIPDEALDQEDFRNTIREMIDELPGEQRSALLLRYFNEISVKEIAQIQGVTEGTVKSRLNYARKAIAQAVESYEKKTGVRLHIAGVGPMLLWFFRASRRGSGMAVASGTAGAAYAGSSASASAAAASTGAAAAAATGAKAGLAAMGKVAATKVVAAVAAAAVGITGVTVAVTTLLNKPKTELWSGFVHEITVERSWVGTDREGYLVEDEVYLENGAMQVQLEIQDAQEYAYTGSLTVTWEDGEVYRTPCRITDFREGGDTYRYTLYIDPLFLRSEPPEMAFDPVEFVSAIPLEFHPETGTVILKYFSQDLRLEGELTLKEAENSLLVTQPIREAEEHITSHGDDGRLLQYMKRLDGSYGWVDGEEYEQIRDAMAPPPEDGVRRVYPDVVYLRIPGKDEAIACLGTSYEYRGPFTHGEMERQVDGMPVTRIRFFTNPYELVSIDIPDSIVILEDESLANNELLRELDIPGSVRHIGNSAFFHCVSLEKVTLREGLLSIGERAFQDCAALKAILLPEGLTGVGSMPFYGCASLKSVSLPATLVDVEDYLIYNCPALEQLEVAPGNPVYHSSGNCIIETEAKTLVAGCKESEIPDDGSVTVIGRYCFAANGGLTELVIPEGVTEIGYCAFVKCGNLREITLPRSIKTIDDQAFKACEGLQHIYYAGTIAEFGKIQGIRWDAPCHDFQFNVHCTDGELIVG